MCTCISFKTKDNYFGRTLDLEYRFNEKVVVTPREYEFTLKNEKSFKTKYAIIGMATIVNNYPLYAEAANEKGLGVAGLYFTDNCHYKEEETGKINITPFELIPWILGNFGSIEELRNKLTSINIINKSFEENIPLTQLHWMISDSKESIVLEQTIEGLNIYDNTVGVLTNNPPFDYHLINLNNYLNLSVNFAENRFTDKIMLDTYANGMGAIGLPGDSSSASRFVRTVFNKLNSVCDTKEEDSVSQFFHILNSASMLKGLVVTKDNKFDITNYACCINLSQGIYYYKTYNNNQITAVKLNDRNMNSDKLDVYDLIENQQINYMN